MFYGQADCKGRGESAPLALFESKYENFDPLKRLKQCFWSLEKNSRADCKGAGARGSTLMVSLIKEYPFFDDFLFYIFKSKKRSL